MKHSITRCGNALRSAVQGSAVERTTAGARRAECAHRKNQGRAKARAVARRRARRATTLRTAHAAIAAVLMVLAVSCAWLATGVLSPRSHAQDTHPGSGPHASAETESSGAVSETPAMPEARASETSAVPDDHDGSGSLPDASAHDMPSSDSPEAGFAVRARMEGMGRPTGPVVFRGHRTVAFGKDGSRAALRITISVSGEDDGMVARPSVVRLHVPAPQDAEGNALGTGMAMEGNLDWGPEQSEDGDTEEVEDSENAGRTSGYGGTDGVGAAGDTDGTRRGLGTASFCVRGEGMYLLSEFTVQLVNLHGETTTYPLSQALAGSGKVPEYETVILDQGDTPGRGLKIDVAAVHDAASGAPDATVSGGASQLGEGSAAPGEYATTAGVPDASGDPDEDLRYFSTRVAFGVTVTDRWFAFHRAVEESRHGDGDSGSSESPALSAAFAESIRSVSDASDPRVVSDWSVGCAGNGWDRIMPESVGGEDAKDSVATISTDAHGIADVGAGDVDGEEQPDATVAGEGRAASWHAQCIVGESMAADGKQTLAEGTYRYMASYQGLLGFREAVAACHDTREGVSSCEFVIDATPPAFGNTRIEGAYEHLDSWLRVRPGFRIEVGGITDGGSGVAQASLECVEAQPCAADGVTVRLQSDGREKVPEVPGEASSETGAHGEAAGTTRDAHAAVSVEFPSAAGRWEASRIVLSVRDHAGNRMIVPLSEALGKAEGGSLTGVSTIVMEQEAPSASVTYQGCESSAALCPHGASVTVRIDDVAMEAVQWFDPGRVIGTVRVDGRVVRSILARDLQLVTRPDAMAAAPRVTMSADAVAGTYSFFAGSDGFWEIDAWAVSMRCGPHTTTKTSHVGFTVDMTAPRLGMTMESTGAEGYFTGGVQVSLECVERNAHNGIARLVVEGRDASGNPVRETPGVSWRYMGDCRWVAAYSWHREGRYSMRLEAVDDAGNQASNATLPSFVLDSTQPRICIDGIEESHAYSGKVAISIHIEEPLLDGGVDWSLSGVRRGMVHPVVDAKASEGGMTLTLGEFSYDRSCDDVYDLKVSATDKAGNAADSHVSFSVNRFGSTYAFPHATQRAQGAYLREAEDVEIDEINVSGIVPDSVRIRVARGEAVRSLAEGEYRRLPGDAGGWSMTRYVVPADVFAEDGWYRVLVSSTDAAGNHSDNARLGAKEGDAADASAELAFAVDSTPPQVHVGTTGSVHMHDAMAMDHAELIVDGATTRRWDDDSGDGAMADLPADGRYHDVRIIAVDKAGNTADANARVQTMRGGWALSAGMGSPAGGLAEGKTSNARLLVAPLCVGIIVPICAFVANRVMRRALHIRRHARASRGRE